MDDTFDIVKGVTKWIVINAFIEFYIYWTGRITLTVLTLGQYPRNRSEQKKGSIFITTGFVLNVAFLVSLGIFNSSRAP